MNGEALEVVRSEPGMLGDFRQHPRADFFTVTEREGVIVEPVTLKRAMRSALPLDAPSDPEQRGEDSSRP